jgi:hypothetical protein
MSKITIAKWRVETPVSPQFKQSAMKRSRATPEVPEMTGVRVCVCECVEHTRAWWGGGGGRPPTTESSWILYGKESSAPIGVRVGFRVPM